MAGAVRQAVAHVKQDFAVLGDQHGQAGDVRFRQVGEEGLDPLRRRRQFEPRIGSVSCKILHRFCLAAQAGGLGGGESGAVATVDIDAHGQAALHHVQLPHGGRHRKLVGLGSPAQQPANKSPVALDVLNLQQEAVCAGLELDGHQVIVSSKASRDPVVVN